jgi:hypothetical protein
MFPQRSRNRARLKEKSCQVSRGHAEQNKRTRKRSPQPETHRTRGLGARDGGARRREGSWGLKSPTRPSLQSCRAGQLLGTTTPRRQRAPQRPSLTSREQVQNCNRKLGCFSPPGNYLLQLSGINLGTYGWGSPYRLREAKPRRRAPRPYLPPAVTPSNRPTAALWRWYRGE